LGIASEFAALAGWRRKASAHPDSRDSRNDLDRSGVRTGEWVGAMENTDREGKRSECCMQPYAILGLKHLPGTDNHLSRRMNRLVAIHAAGKCVLSTLAFLLVLPGLDANAQTRRQAKKASELIKTVDKPVISARVMERTTPENSSILVSLSRQRAYLMSNGEIAIDTPISSGKRAGMTPTGEYTILQKNADHRSNIYGDFVDSRGRVVRSGVSTKIDSAPSGTRFVGAPMKYFMRLTWTGIGLHVGHLPGYPASHGCVRLPAEIAPLIYKKVKVGTPVKIVD
jgi:lipoprotein-anchoring transpeptidase ErfK/SrfK